MRQNRIYRAWACGLALMTAVGMTACGTNESKAPAASESGYQIKGTDDKEETVLITCGQDGITIAGEGAVNDGGMITISQSGTYRLKGVLEEGRIEVDVKETDAVTLVFDGFEITGSGYPAVYGGKCEGVTLVLEDGTVNRVTDSETYDLPEGEDEPDAAVFLQSDLTIPGEGPLEVNGNYSDGIRSKGNLKVDSGILKVSAKEDGIKGKDSLVVDGGTIAVAAGDDGVKSSKGGVIINGGTLNVEESEEGIEAKTIDINGGSVTIRSNDDGINAVDPDSKAEEADNMKKMSSFEAAEGVYVRINGGIVTIHADADGVDSNGDFYVDGGELYITGPSGGGDGALDYNGNGIITGGVVAAAGSSGMAQGFSEGSEQPGIMVYFDSPKEAGTQIVLEDEAGTPLVSFTPQAAYECVVLSAPQLEAGNTYRISSGDEIIETVLEESQNVVGTVKAGRGMNGAAGGPRMGGQENGRGMGKRQEGMEPGQKPEGMDEALPQDLDAGERTPKKPADKPDGGGEPANPTE